jgi:uncharacterized protein YkwD
LPAFGASPDLNALRRTSLELVNKDRKAHGLPPLGFDDTLNRIAQAHAEDMLRKDYFAHESPGGSTPMKRFLSAGGSRELVLRENIFHCNGCAQPADVKSVAELESGWMHSPGHRANILAEGITRYGFGLAEDRTGGRYAVQDFAGPGLTAGGTAIEPGQVNPLAASIVNALRKGHEISAVPALAAAAAASIPKKNFASVSLASINPLAHLPPGVAFTRYSMLMGACGGCGTAVTSDDVRSFVGRWAHNARNRGILVDPSFTALGMAVAADGGGGKIAVAVIAGN